MPSIFKNVIRSRRKKHKNRTSTTSTTTPVNFHNPSRPSGCVEPTSSSSHDQYTTKKHQPQHQFLRVSIDGDKDGRQSSLHAGNRNRTKSFEKSMPPPCADSNDPTSHHHKHKHKQSGSKTSFLKSLRRKSKHDPIAPDTEATSSGDTAHQRLSESEHDRLRPLRESYPRRSRSFDESPGSKQAAAAAEPTDPLSKPASQNQIHRTTSSGDEKPLSWRATNTKPRYLPYDNDHQATTRASSSTIEVGMGRRSSGNTKTVIMNGDIVLSKSYASKSSCETATITSASSNSKRKAKRRETERNARAAAALDEKANELFEKGYFDKAMACYTKALKLKRRTFAHLLDDTDDIEGEPELRDESGNPADPQTLVSMATSINNIGYLRQRSGDATPEETMAAYVKSLRIKRRILGNDSLSVGKTLNNIGSVHYLKRDFEKAVSAYHEALEIMKANLGDKHPDVATVMSNIGDVYLAKGDKETSIKYYRLALAIRWEAFGEKSPRVVRLLEKISNLEIGDMSRKMANQPADGAEDDMASENMEGSEFHSVSEALRLLQEQVKGDIAKLDQMERDAALETFKDKVIIIRGMRDVWNGSGVELLDNDSASVQTAMSRLSTR